MRYFDVFNGDADGLCALHQFRLARPIALDEITLITGVKRDVTLLDRVAAKTGDQVTVFDISYDQNADSAKRLLDDGVALRYFDHHRATTLRPHRLLDAHIDTSPAVCSSLLVDAYLMGAHRIWAAVAAFGDNLAVEGEKICRERALAASQCVLLRELGECLNYNAYGESESDLYFPPAELYARLRHYRDPFEFIAKEAVFARLKSGYAHDLAHALAVLPQHESRRVAVYVLPYSDWSRRISGAFANQLAQQHPARAHSVLTHNNSGGFTVSVRAPLGDPRGADDVCAAFPGGGGRAGAAGINALPDAQISLLIETLEKTYSD